MLVFYFSASLPFVIPPKMMDPHFPHSPLWLHLLSQHAFILSPTPIFDWLSCALVSVLEGKVVGLLENEATKEKFRDRLSIL
jgi:hypothetical protein